MRLQDTGGPEEDKRIVVSGTAVAMCGIAELGHGDGLEPRTLITSDLAERGDRGLVWLGRRDRSLKVRGMRVSAESVETQFSQHPAIRNVAVVGVSERGLICAVQLGAADAPLDDLAQWARMLLPDHMVPAEFVVVEQWPVLPNGKIDFRRLVSCHHASAGRGKS